MFNINEEYLKENEELRLADIIATKYKKDYITLRNIIKKGDETAAEKGILSKYKLFDILKTVKFKHNTMSGDLQKELLGIITKSYENDVKQLISTNVFKKEIDLEYIRLNTSLSLDKIIINHNLMTDIRNCVSNKNIKKRMEEKLLPKEEVKLIEDILIKDSHHEKFIVLYLLAIKDILSRKEDKVSDSEDIIEKTSDEELFYKKINNISKVTYINSLRSYKELVSYMSNVDNILPRKYDTVLLKYKYNSLIAFLLFKKKQDVSSYTNKIKAILPETRIVKLENVIAEKYDKTEIKYPTAVMIKYYGYTRDTEVYTSLKEMKKAEEYIPNREEEEECYQE